MKNCLFDVSISQIMVAVKWFGKDFAKNVVRLQNMYKDIVSLDFVE